MTETKSDHDRTGLDELALATHPARDATRSRRIPLARANVAAAEAELRDAVRAAWTAGD